MSRKNRIRREINRTNRPGTPSPKGHPIPARRRHQARHRQWKLIGGIAGAIVAFAIFVAVLDISAQPPPPTPPKPISASVLNALAHLPLNTLTTVGKGADTNPPKVLGKQVTLKVHNTPEVLFIGAEYCQYCALERWSLIGAMSRFGTFTGLEMIHSSVAEYHIATFTFLHAHYQSPYFDFVSREMYSNNTNAAGAYIPLQKLSSTQSSLLSSIGQNGFPFVDFGGMTAQVGSESSKPGPVGLQGLTWQQIITKLRQPSTAPAQMILGGVNYDTAAICKMINNQDKAVCATPLIQSLEGGL